MAINNKNDDSNSYPGGKGGAGVYQNIINLTPPHKTYIETHLGGGSIFLRKKLADKSILLDIDPKVTEKMLEILSSKMKMSSGSSPPIIKNEDALSFLKSYDFKGNEFIYCDPPYLMETRKGGKIYDFEYTEEDHIRLLNILDQIKCNIMISGYWSSLYNVMLPGWNTFSFEAQTRRGKATEWVWFNYPFPKKLHDYSYLGKDFRERERIKNKKNRWLSRLLKMPDLERNSIIEELLNFNSGPHRQKW